MSFAERGRCWIQKQSRPSSGWEAKWIARTLGLARNTVRRYLAAGEPVAYRRPQRSGALDDPAAAVPAAPGQPRCGASAVEEGIGHRDEPAHGRAGVPGVPVVAVRTGITPSSDSADRRLEKHIDCPGPSDDHLQLALTLD